MILKKQVFLSILIGIFFVTAGCSNQNQNTKPSNQENKPEVKAVHFQIVPAKNQKLGQIRDRISGK